MSQELTDYLEELHSEIILGKCAGRFADISELHQNRLIEIDAFLRDVSDAVNQFGKKSFDHATVMNSELVFKPKLTKWESARSKRKNPLDAFQAFTERLTSTSHLDRRKYLHHAFSIRNFMLEHEERAEGDFSAERLQPSFNLMKTLESETQEIHIIYGDPGYGKTIHLQQFTESFVSSERIKPTRTLPIYFKAKTLAEIIKTTCTAGFTMKYNDEPVEGIVFADDSQLNKTLAGLISDKITRIDQKSVHTILASHEKRLYIIDALDECHEGDLRNVMKFISEISMSDAVNIVATCRNSHAKIINSMWQALRDKSGVKFHEYHIDFTKQELRYQMPKKLTAAWGIGGQLMESQVETMFSEYELVLTHPLFVGIFARLLTDVDSFEGFEKLSETDLNVGTYTLRHVDFLNKVIDMGIEIELKNRPQNITPTRLQEIFCAISYANSRNRGDATIDSLKDILWLDLGIILQPEEVEALKNGVSLLYSTDGSSVEWVHKTLYEIATARFYFDDSNYLYSLEYADFAECFQLALILLNMNRYSLSADDSILKLVSSLKTGNHVERSFSAGLLRLHSQWDSIRFDSVKEQKSGGAKLIPSPSDSVSKEFVEALEFLANMDVSLPAHQFKNCLMDVLQSKALRIQVDEGLLSMADELNLLPEVVRIILTHKEGVSRSTFLPVLYSIPGTFKRFFADDMERYAHALSKCDPEDLIEIYFEVMISFIDSDVNVFFANVLLSRMPKLAAAIVAEAMTAPGMIDEKLEHTNDEKEILSILLSEPRDYHHTTLTKGRRLTKRVIAQAKKDGELR